MTTRLIEGDLVRQDVDAIVNPWNNNFLPLWWPSRGVSGQLKTLTGPEPWRELKQAGWISTGQAVVTSAGRLPRIRALIHVAGLHPWWLASQTSVTASIRSAAAAAAREGFTSVATPLVGAGTGGVPEDRAIAWIREELQRRPADGVRWSIVRRPRL